MNNQPKNTALPKLRFPEFREEAEWIVEPLGNVAKLIKEKAGSKSYKLMSITSGAGLVSQMEKFGREIAGASYKNYYVIRKGDFAYNKSSTKADPEGQIALLESEESGAVPNSIFTCFRVDDKTVLPHFLKYPFANNIHGRWLKNLITVGARVNGALSVDSKHLLSLPVALPSIPEQQKIAATLSSLDDLLTAQTAQLTALQTHKRGLMQALFPTEGETVPKLRFPEFQDAADWEEKPLGKLAKNLDNKRIPITGSERIKGVFPYYGASGIIDYVKDFIFDEELLCVSEDGANLLARNYPIAFSISGKTWVNNHAHVLRFKNYHTQVLVQEYLNFINLENYLTGMAQPKLNRAKLDIIPIPLPSAEEQLKIANTLSSIDALVTAQRLKIDSLNLHKKALLSVLFPPTTNAQK